MKRLHASTAVMAIFWLLCSVSLTAQDVPDSKGRDFWFTFLPNFHNGERQGLNDPVSQREHELQIYIGAERPTKGTISWRTENGTERSQNFLITNPASLFRFATFYQGIELRGMSRSGGTLDFLNSQNERVAPQHFHIVADDDVTVYALNQAPLTSEAFLVLPTDAVANDYVVMSYPTDVSGSGAPNPNTTPSQFAIVATADSTVVTIEPTVPTPRNTSGRPYSVTLQQGESFLVQADPREIARGDLTGTRVRSTQPVAVFAGHNRAIIPTQASSQLTSRDCLIEQMNPVRTWGKSAFVTPLAPPTDDQGVGYDIFRVVAGFDSTEVYVDGSLRGMLMAGDLYEGQLLGGYEITTSRPALTAQYKKSSGVNTSGGGGPDTLEYADPFMMLVPPAEQFMTSYRFINIQSYIYDLIGARLVITDSVYKEQWLNVVIPSAKIGSLVLDGAPVGPGRFRPIGSSGFSYAQIPMRDGVHEISADTLFGIYVYGYGAAVSYGYIGGMAFRPLDVYPPEISAFPACGGFRGMIVDTVIADTKVREVNVLADTNAVLELEAFNPPQAIVPYTVRLRDPFRDGSITFSAVDGVKQRQRFSLQVPGFTVAISGAGPSTTLSQRTSVVAVGRERCDSIEIENYGKFPRTFTVSFTGATRVDATQPLTLGPGERRMLRYCRAGTAPQITLDTMVFSDSCLRRPVVEMTFEERLDDKGPLVQRDPDPCDSVTVVTISDERSSDLGLQSARILDSVLVNCTIDTVLNEVLERQYAIRALDAYADVIYGFEAIDSVGNISRVIDTIPGFNMSIGGTLDRVVRHAFDTTIIGRFSCDTIPLENFGISSLSVENVYLRGNTLFSAPQSQFSLSIAANGGKSALIVCFSPLLGDTTKTFTDTIDFNVNCKVRRLILVGVGRSEYFSGISRCDAPVTVRARKLLGALVTPQPASDRMTVTFDEADVRSATIRLVDLTGIVRWERTWSGEPTRALEIDCSDVPNGLYSCQITTTGTQSVPVVISR
ncbi:MAG: hypothetical protein FGM33_02490 [Candidatus Kapabacteria bacterium]|nr:hypothetical protein [Candidatus Kapabacteria bacterium]